MFVVAFALAIWCNSSSSFQSKNRAPSHSQYNKTSIDDDDDDAHWIVQFIGKFIFAFVVLCHVMWVAVDIRTMLRMCVVQNAAISEEWVRVEGFIWIISQVASSINCEHKTFGFVRHTRYFSSIWRSIWQANFQRERLKRGPQSLYGRDEFIRKEVTLHWVNQTEFMCKFNCLIAFVCDHASPISRAYLFSLK